MHSSRMPRHLQHKIKSYYALVRVLRCMGGGEEEQGS